jgi:hypothetical protein
VKLPEAKPGQFHQFAYCDGVTYMDLLMVVEGKSCHQGSPEATTVANAVMWVRGERQGQPSSHPARPSLHIFHETSW